MKIVIILGVVVFAGIILFACSKKKARSTETAGIPTGVEALLDTSILYPVIVPHWYLGSPGAVQRGLLDGLDVALVVNRQGEANSLGISAGIAMYVTREMLVQANLTEAKAYEIALENLAKAAERGEVKASGIASAAGKVELVIWSDHWLAATCLLLPGLHKVAARALGTEKIVALIPHRDILILFADESVESRSSKIDDLLKDEQDGRKPISNRPILLAPNLTKPFYEEAVGHFLD